MKKNHATSLRSLAAILCMPLLNAAPLHDALAQDIRPAIRPGGTLTTIRRAPAERGTNAFASINRDEQGHSLANSYLLAMVSHYMYPHAYEPNPGDNFEVFKYKAEAKFKLWGMSKVNIKKKDNVQYVVMSNQNVIIVGFRGSDSVFHMDNFADWIVTDSTAGQRKVSTWGTVKFTSRNWLGQLVNVYKEPGVHTGIRNAYWKVRQDINDLILDHGGKSKKLFITGHSLGAGLAIFAAIDQGYAQDRPSSRRFVAQGVYTYGGPRVGNGIFKRLYDSKLSDGGAKALNTHRYVNESDIIAMLPGDTVVDDAMYVLITLYGPGEPHNNVKYIHVGRTCNIRQDGTIDRDSAEYRGIGRISKHHSSQYAYKIFYAHVADRSWASRMPLPPAPVVL